jgi:hypothetical protein
VQDEGEPLGGRQRVEHDEQRQADGIGEEHLLFGVGAVLETHDRIRDMSVEGFLAPRRA